MSLTPRDRRIVLILVPLLLLGVYWFVLLAPQREESAKVETELTKARGERDTAQAQIGQLNAAKASFAGDYQTVIRMGKAIPESVDMPSLLVQLDRAARGTGIDMAEITVTPADEKSGGAAPAGPGGGGPGAGGSGAQSMPGKAAQGAGNAVNDANAKSEQNADTANAPSGAAAPAAQQAPALSSVGLQFKLRGDFFDMADFFHRMKRFVRVVNDQIVVRGRLISIDSWDFKVEGGKITAGVGATVYLSPKADGGVTAGASPTGPAATPGGGNVAADPASSSPPTAAATP
jgi:Tfp pilus assembly protein PilO